MDVAPPGADAKATGGENDSGGSVGVEQLARSVLEASCDTSGLSALPIPICEAIVLFLAALDDKASAASTKELVVRALRGCSGATRQAPDQIIRTVTPFILDLSSPALRQSAASCILHCTSNSPIPTLVATFPTTLAILSRALAFPPLSPPPPLRFASTCLRVLNATISRLPPVSTEDARVVAGILGSWVYYRESPLGGPSPVPPERGRPSLGAVGGVMGGFMPATVGKRKQKEPMSMSRSSSMSSLAGASSESEADDGAAKGPRYTSIQTRLDALACLRTLALNNSRALYGQWQLFFADSPYARSRKTLVTLIETDPAVAVRVRACRALDALLQGSTAYLAIAEDRPTKASFTSLSSKLGDVVSELHSSVTTLVAAPYTTSSTPLHLALLHLARTLGETAPYGRMRRPLAPPLVEALTPQVKHEDEAVATGAAAALSAILKNVVGHSTVPHQLDATPVAQMALQVLLLPRSETLVCELLELLAVSSTHSAGAFDLTPALTLLHSGLATASVPVQEAQMAFISTVFKASSESLSLAPYATSLLRVLQVALQSSRPHLRVLACGVLGTPSLGSLTKKPDVDAFAEGARLAADVDVGVRSAACRLLGLLVKAPDAVIDGETLGTMLEVLGARCSEPDPVKSTASWALANCLDAASQSDAPLPDALKLIHRSLPLVAASNGEKVQTNGLRALGSLLKLSGAVPEDTVALVVQALADCVGAGPVKVRWNAAAASAHAFSGTRFSASPLSLALEPLLLALSSTLDTCLNYKVRIQATTALTGLQSRGMFGSAFAVVGARVRVARERAREEEAAEGGVPREEVAHFQSLVLKLDRCLEHLSQLSSANE